MSIAKEIAQWYIEDKIRNNEEYVWKDGTRIFNIIILYDMDNNPSAYMFELKNKKHEDNGYIVIGANEDTTPIIQFSYSKKAFIHEAIQQTKDKFVRKIKIRK